MTIRRKIKINKDYDLVGDISNTTVEEIDTRHKSISPLDEMLEKAKTLGDLAFESVDDVSGCNPYSCTFTYNPFAKFSLSDTYDEYVQYDEHVILKDPKKITRTKQFGYFNFIDQYRIFQKHFKRWYKDMNSILDKKDKLKGYSVYIEKTKLGTLHAHTIIYSNCNYNEAFGHYSATIWARIAKGQVRAMNGAFDKVHDMQAYNKYIIKDTELSLF